MDAANKFERCDWLVATALFIVSLALHAPFRSHLVYHWDGAQFALAIKQFNVSLGQPHAPGYILYVMLGRLVNLFVGDPHTSLVWLSEFAGAALASVMYLLGAAMFGRRAGVAAALFAATSPMVWFHSCVALMYVVDALLVCVLVLACWRAMNRGGGWRDAVLLGVLMAVVAGVRPQTALGLAPVAVFTVWKFSERRVAMLAVAVATATGLSLLWFVPMVSLSGGLVTYLEIVRRFARLTTSQTLTGGGLRALVWNVTLAGAFCWNGLVLGAPLLIGGVARRVFSGDRECAPGLKMVAVWVVPMLVLATAVAFTEQPGHVLSYLPALLLLTGFIVAQIRVRTVFTVATAVVCAGNFVAFVVWPRSWDGVFFGVGRTAREIREHDRQVGQAVDAIRAHYRPDEAIVCHAMAAHYLFGMRHFQICLPEFEQYQLQEDPTYLKPAGKPVIHVRGGRLEFVSRVDIASKRVALLVVPPGLQVDIFNRWFDVGGAGPIDGSGGTVFAVPVGAIR